MVAFLDLWLAILLSAVFVFIASSILHMLVPLHRGDYKKLPGEAKVMEAMRGEGVSRGQYMFPCAESMKEMNTPEMIEKLNQGPVGYMVVLPSGPFKMGKSLAIWFAYCLGIGVFVAYLASLAALPRGAEYMDVFRVTGTVAILGHAFTHIPDSIWKGVTWTITAKFILDGVIYGLITAGTFGWLWPAAV